MSNILKYQNPSSPLLISDNSITDDNYNEKVREMYRLRAEADSLGTKYTKADILGEDIAAYTLNKYKDYRGSAIHYGKWAGTPKPYEDADVNFLFDSIIRLEDNGIVDFLKSYANSEGFNRIRNNQLNWWKTRHPRKKYLYPGESYDKKQIKYYKDNISQAEKTINYVLDGYPELSFSIPDKRVTYTFKPRYGEDTKRPFDYAQMHEFAHLFNYPVSVFDTINAEVLDQNTNVKKNDHDEHRNEKHADNLGVKYLLFKEGIYDARGNKDITPEQIQQLRNKYPKLRFLQQLNNEDAAFQINHVVQNTTDPNRIDYKDPVTFAKKGGRIHIKKKNRGKFTDYCGGKVTEECIAKGKNSKDPKIRKRATFAANARRWKHENGGTIKTINIMIPDIIKFFNGGGIPMFQEPAGKMWGPNYPGRYMRFTSVGSDSQGNKFGYTEEVDNDRDLVREIRNTGDSLIFVNDPNKAEIFTSPYKPRPLKMDQMSPEMWKRVHDHFDELKRQWIENPTMR